MSELIKTIKLCLHTTEEQEVLFRELTDQYRLACNYISQYVFDHNFILNTVKLHNIMYRDMRNVYGLKSQFACSTFKTVVSKYKAVRTQLFQNPFKYKDEKGEWRYVKKTFEWLWKPIYFKRPQVDLVRNKDYSFVGSGNIVSINTLGARVKCAYEKEHFKDYFDGTWKFGTAKLVELKGIWYLHVPVTKEVGDFDKNNVNHIVGIDRGLRFIATMYDERGKTEFISGKKIATKRDKFQKVREELQSKGTKSAKRRLKAMSGRENRWMTDVNHCISKTLVEQYGENTLFVLEDLSGVSFEDSNLSKSAKQNRQLRSWAFYQLEQFLSYKAMENNSNVIKVSAKYTSQRCPICGNIDKNNRDHKNHLYECECGYKSNDDRVGAMNIYNLGLMWLAGVENPRYKLTTKK